MVLIFGTIYVLLLPPVYQPNAFIFTCDSGPDIRIGGEYARWKLQAFQNCLEKFAGTNGTEPNRSEVEQAVIDNLDLPKNKSLEWELTLIPGTGLFRLTVEAESKEMAQVVANELAHYIIEPFNHMDERYQYGVIELATYPETPVRLWNRLDYAQPFTFHQAQ